jgi:hypothetical protein
MCGSILPPGVRGKDRSNAVVGYLRNQPERSRLRIVEIACHEMLIGYSLLSLLEIVSISVPSSRPVFAAVLAKISGVASVCDSWIF